MFMAASCRNCLPETVLPNERNELKPGRRAFLKAAAAFVATLPVSAQPKPPPRFGLQTYSLRYEARKDLPATLALIRKMGFEEVEVSGLYERSAAEYRRLLDDNGLKAVSLMASYGQLDKDVASAADDAQRLGAPYVVCSTLPQKRYMTDEECRSGAEFLNSRGEALAKSGLRLCYHTHGTEFSKSADGTIFDTLIKRTDARFAHFEMDIYWIVYAHQDPVKLLHRYPGRFPLMHVKDIKPGTVLGGLPRDVREDESVPLGTGLVDIPAALRAAQETGTRHYFIEDEAVDATLQIPISLRYLASMRW
jgi:sugar phosphate isomerase/epimerase